jgi:hypothetical protein
MNGAKSQKVFVQQAGAARRVGARGRLGMRCGALALGMALFGSVAVGIAAPPMASAGPPQSHRA